MASKKTLAIAQRADASRPHFASLDAAAKWYRTYRNTMLKRLISAVGKSGPTLNFTLESLVPLEDWSFRIHASNGFRTIGFRPGELQSAMMVYAMAVAVTQYASDWIVTETHFAAGHYDLGILGYYSRHFPLGSRKPTDTSLWTGKWNRKRDSLYRFAADFKRDFEERHLDRVLPFRDRLSTDVDRREGERRMLVLGLSPWKEDDIIRGVELHGKGLWRQHIEDVVSDPAICGKKMIRFLRGIFSKENHHWQCWIVQKLHALEGPRVLDLCLTVLKHPEEIRADIPRILYEIGNARAIPTLIERLNGMTRLKRKNDEGHFFFWSISYLKLVGNGLPVVEELFDLLESRLARLTSGERVAIAHAHPRFPRPRDVPPDDLPRVVTVRTPTLGNKRAARRLVAASHEPTGLVLVD